MAKRSAEDVCMEYALVARLIQVESAQIRPWNCELVKTAEATPWYIGAPETPEPCLSRLFSKPKDGEDPEEHRSWQAEFEDEMCSAC